jgi:methylated-DNA-[protein]-cysteine S-methyltransferase
LCLFDTAIGKCGIAWREDALISVQLPEADEAGTLERLRRRLGADVRHAGEVRHPSEGRHPRDVRHPREGGDPEHPEPTRAPPWVASIIARIQALLEGAPDDLRDVPLAMDGVPAFHQRVYEITRAIPPGRTLTYGEVAQRLGDPHAARAVGQALGHNPFAPVVPCHRVLAARNAGGGFSAEGGVATKLRMLQIEHAQLGAERGLFD